MIAQRNLIRGRRLADQREKLREICGMVFDRPHAYYQRVLIEDAPVIVTKQNSLRASVL